MEVDGMEVERMEVGVDGFEVQSSSSSPPP